MKIFLKTLKYLGYSIVGFIAFLLLYLLSAAILSRIAVNTEEVSQKEETIWLLSNGAHTDIVMPVKNDFHYPLHISISSSSHWEKGTNSVSSSQYSGGISE